MEKRGAKDWKKELASQVKTTHTTLNRVVEEEFRSIFNLVGGEVSASENGRGCLKSVCSRRERYRILLGEAVRVLEETRGSFKSGKLSSLRIRLMKASEDLPAREI